MLETTNIYALFDPINGHVRYIGKANVVHKRYFSHLNDNRRSHKCCWIKSVLNKGHKPEIEILDIVPKSEWQFWERYYISLFRSWGFDLTNRSDGGEGTEHTLETRKRMSLLKIGKPGPWKGKKRPESIELLRKINLGKKQSEDTKLKRSISNGKPILQFGRDGSFIKEWHSISFASRELKINSIMSNLKGKTTHSGGYIFKYKE